MLGVWAWVPPPILKGVVHVILRMHEVSCNGVGLSWSEDMAPSWLSPLMGEETVPYWVGTLVWGGAEMHVSLVLWGAACVACPTH